MITRRLRVAVGAIVSALMFFAPSFASQSIAAPSFASQSFAGSSVALAQTTTPPSVPVKQFRLLAPGTTFDGKTRAELLILGYRAKVTATKAAIESPNCAERPQFGTTAAGKALAKKLFTLPAELGKTMTCTMPATSTLMIDHIGVICNDSNDHQASVECIDSRFEPLKQYRVTIDGVDLGIGRFKLITEKFVVDLKQDSPYGLQGGKWRLRAGGWPVLIAGLTPGDHTVKTTYKLGKNRQSTTVVLTVTK